MIDSVCGAKMLNKILLISVLCCAAATGSAPSQLTIASAPKSLDFQSSAAALPAADLSEIYAASLGSAVRSANTEWSGLFVRDPFNTPAVAVALQIVGAPKALALTEAAGTYQLDGSAQAIGAALESLDERVAVQHVDLAEQPQKAQKLSGAEQLVALKPQSNAGERKFLEQVAQAKQVASEIVASGEPTFVQLRLDAGALQASSEQGQAEAGKLLQQLVREISADLEKRVAGGALVTVVESPAEEVEVVRRQKRQAVVVDDVNNWNLAEEYNEDYPVIFNIILWFGVIFVFSLLAISYAIGGMDPGRDSIIYRMTSTRIKKDN